MKLLLEFTKRCLLVATPLLTSYMVASAPSQATGIAIASSSKPPGDSHQICTQIGGERNGGLIVKRPLSKFVRQHKQ